MKREFILASLLALTIYHLGYYNAIHTMSINNPVSEVKEFASLEGIPLYPPSYRELKGIKD